MMESLKSYIGKLFAIYLGVLSVFFTFTTLSYFYLSDRDLGDLGYLDTNIFLAVIYIIPSLFLLVIYIVFFNLFLNIKFKNIVLFGLIISSLIMSMMISSFLSPIFHPNSFLGTYLLPVLTSIFLPLFGLLVTLIKNMINKK